MDPITITNEQKIPIKAAPTTAAGKPATFDGPMKVTIVSGDVTQETQDAADPLTITLVSGDAPGVSEVLIEADADLGSGVVTIQDHLTLTVTGAQASSFGLVAGTAVAK